MNPFVIRYWEYQCAQKCTDLTLEIRILILSKILVATNDITTDHIRMRPNMHVKSSFIIYQRTKIAK